MRKKKNTLIGFTLIELLLVIAILGILATLIIGNFITSLKKGRDARRKGDLEQVQRALEMYYEDNRAYPEESEIVFGSEFSKDNYVYMKKLPNDPTSGNNYLYQSDGTYYKLYSCIENSLDQGPGVDQSGYEVNCGNCDSCRYGISSPNTTP